MERIGIEHLNDFQRGMYNRLSCKRETIKMILVVYFEAH